MRDQYLVFLMLFAFVVLNAVMFVVLSHFAGPRRPTIEKGRPYESGMPPLGAPRERFSVKFYLIAMLFILFDIEAVFLLPWAVVFKTLSRALTINGQSGRSFVFFEMMIFIAVLLVGYVYVWKKGLFEWNRN
jgi:NADH-quinone oxidoreductase subunit A